MASRPFRTEESLTAERETRDKIAPLLSVHGFEVVSDDREAHGTAITQFISARRDSILFKIHVRLCWRRGGRNARELLYSAAQLRTRLIDNSFEKTLNFIAERSRANEVTHILFVQDGSEGITFAALVPAEDIPAIWQQQRAVSANILQRGDTGRWRKNHAENGSSPTIWLQDDRWPSTHVVADVFWNWPSVINVLSLPISGKSPAWDDSVDDLPIDVALIGSDGSERTTSSRSGFRRDPKVREAVIRRANGICERESCGTHRDYPGFLDVHHILGVGVSDRIWTCVALCPNCHREAHFSPNRDLINAQLAAFAGGFASAG